MSKSGSLTAEQLQFFNSNGIFLLIFDFEFFFASWFIYYRFIYCAGYIVLENFVSSDEIDAMMKRMEQLLDEFDYSTSSVFSTKNQVNSFSAFVINILNPKP